jgi:GxxExxY protein
MDFYANSRVDEGTEDLAERVIGAAIEVHREVGPGLPESVYRNALSHELTLRGIPHVCEAPVPIYYKGKLVGEGRMDILVADWLINTY